MSERDDSRPEGPEEDSSPEGFEDTVVEILSLGDEEDAADASAERRATPRGGRSRVGSVDMRRLESQLAAERERALRLRADFDNYRKRTERERAEIERYAFADVLRDLLPVVDNLERALGAQGGQGRFRRSAQGRRDDRPAVPGGAEALRTVADFGARRALRSVGPRGRLPGRVRRRRCSDGGARAAARIPSERQASAAVAGQGRRTERDDGRRLLVGFVAVARVR